MVFSCFSLCVDAAGQDLVAPRSQTLLILWLTMAAENSSVAWFWETYFIRCVSETTKVFPFTIRISWGNVVFQKLCQNWDRAEMWSAKNWFSPIIFPASSPHPKHPASKCHPGFLEPSMIISVLTPTKLSSSLHLKTQLSSNTSVPDLPPATWIQVSHEVRTVYASRFFVFVYCTCCDSWGSTVVCLRPILELSSCRAGDEQQAGASYLP